MALTKEQKRTKAREFLRAFANRGNWLVVDTETTGPDEEQDELCEIAVLTSEGSPLIDQLVRPKREISEGAQDVHGITPEDVEGAPDMSELKVVDWLFRNFPVLIYNRAFDGPIIENSFERRGVEVDREKWDLRCVMEAYAMAFGEWSDYHGSYSWVKLEQACENQSIPFDGVDLHRAAGDAELTRRLVRSFTDLSRTPDEPEPELDFG